MTQSFDTVLEDIKIIKKVECSNDGHTSGCYRCPYCTKKCFNKNQLTKHSQNCKECFMNHLNVFLDEEYNHFDKIKDIEKKYFGMCDNNPINLMRKIINKYDNVTNNNVIVDEPVINNVIEDEHVINDVIEDEPVVTDDEYINNDEEHQLNICNIDKFVNTTYNIVNINKYKQSLINFRNNWASDYIDKTLNKDTSLNNVSDDKQVINEPPIISKKTKKKKKKKIKITLDIEDVIEKYVSDNIRKQIYDRINNNNNNTKYFYIQSDITCKSNMGWDENIWLTIEDYGDNLWGVSDTNDCNPDFIKYKQGIT